MNKYLRRKDNFTHIEGYNYRSLSSTDQRNPAAFDSEPIGCVGGPVPNSLEEEFVLVYLVFQLSESFFLPLPYFADES